MIPRRHAAGGNVLPVQVMAVMVMSVMVMSLAGCTTPGSPDGPDADQTGNVNGTEPECRTNDDCPDAEYCQSSVCEPLPVLALDVGFTEPESDTYTSLEDDMELPFLAGFQGLSELMVTIRVSGVPAATGTPLVLELTQSVTVLDTGLVIHEFTDGAAELDIVAEGEAEIRDRRLILDSSPASIDGRSVELACSVVMDLDGRTVTADVTRQATLILAE